MEVIETYEDGVKYLREQMLKAHITGHISTATVFAMLLGLLEPPEEEKDDIELTEGDLLMNKIQEKKREVMEKISPYTPGLLIISKKDRKILSRELCLMGELVYNENNLVQYFDGMDVIQAKVDEPIVAFTY